MNRICWQGVWGVFAGLASAGLVSAGTLELRVVDEAGERLPCRVLVQGATSYLPAQDDLVTLKVGDGTWFMCPGHARIELPEGEAVTLRVERGHEYLRGKETLAVNAEETLVKQVMLRRWVDLRARGYASGENHLHVDSRALGPMLVAEGLDFGTSLTWWNGPDARRPVPEGQGRVRALSFGGRTVTASVFDAELEHAWGAAYVQHLPGALPFDSDPRRPNLDFLKHAVAQGGLVHYQGGWSREVGLDALLGFVHTVNVCNNNFHLHKFQPRTRYSNLLNVKGFPVYPDTERGMMRMNTDSYYRLLNWGLRLAAGAGSATGAKETPVGYNRAYVRVSPEAGLEAFNDAWARGENFVTNGPMLFLKVGEEGVRPGGDVVLPPGGGQVSIKVEALSAQPLEAVELIVNGEVVHRIAAGAGRELREETSLAIERGAWVAARCVAWDDLLTEAELAGYQRRSGLAERPSRMRFAHTSPVYVSVGGKPVRVRRSLEEGVAMMEALGVEAGERAAPSYRGPFLQSLEAAKGMLRQRLIEANETRDPHPLAAPGVTSLTHPGLDYDVPEEHEVTLRRGDVTAVVVDNAPLEARGHRAGYNGLASLTHRQQSRNVFVPAYAGLNFEHIHDGTTENLVEKFEPRVFPMELRVIDAHTVEVYQPPTGHWKLESCGRYHLLEDGTVEYTFECIPRADGYAQNYIGLFWASYMNAPENPAIHFRDHTGAWVESVSPGHGERSTHAPWSHPLLPPVDADFPLTLVNHPSGRLYAEPWYYGISRGMAWVAMFREKDRMWFAQSPSGGGQGNPAWDFQWFIPDYQVNEAYGFVMRLAYLPFTNRASLEASIRPHLEALETP